MEFWDPKSIHWACVFCFLGFFVLFCFLSFFFGFFWPKPFFLEPQESPAAAAAIIPSRVGSKATGNSRFCITAFFLKAQHSSLTLPFFSPSGRVMELPNFPEQELSTHCAIWPPGSQESLKQNRLSEPPGAPEGLGNSPSVLGTLAGWSAWQVFHGRVGGCSEVCRTTWCSCRADTKSQTPGHYFLPGAQSTCGEVAVSQYNPNLSVDLCNIDCPGLEPMEISTGKKPPSCGFSVTLVRGPQKTLSFPNSEITLEERS